VSPLDHSIHRSNLPHLTFNSSGKQECQQTRRNNRCSLFFLPSTSPLSLFTSRKLVECIQRPSTCWHLHKSNSYRVSTRLVMSQFAHHCDAMAGKFAKFFSTSLSIFEFSIWLTLIWKLVGYFRDENRWRCNFSSWMMATFRVCPHGISLKSEQKKAEKCFLMNRPQVFIPNALQLASSGDTTSYNFLEKNQASAYEIIVSSFDCSTFEVIHLNELRTRVLSFTHRRKCASH
jgi:hypothetical protein